MQVSEHENIVLCWQLSDLKVKLQIRKFFSLLILSREILLKKAKMKAKKKPRRRSDSSGGYTLSDIIQSPPAAGELRHTMDRLQMSVIFISLTVFYSSQSFCPRTCQAQSCFGNSDNVTYRLFVSPSSDLSIFGEVRQGELCRVPAGAAHVRLRGELHGGRQSPRRAVARFPRQGGGDWPSSCNNHRWFLFLIVV